VPWAFFRSGVQRGGNVSTRADHRVVGIAIHRDGLQSIVRCRLVGDGDQAVVHTQHAGDSSYNIQAGDHSTNGYLACGAAAVNKRRRRRPNANTRRLSSGSVKVTLALSASTTFHGTGEPLFQALGGAGGVLTQLGRGVALQRVLAQVGEGGGHFSSGQCLAGGEGQGVGAVAQTDFSPLASALKVMA